MRKLLKGLHQFRSEIFVPQQKLFERLVGGQNPDALFITCSDSRINPNLLTQTEPGDLFILRNAGNIIPPYGPYISGEVATIEFAINGLGIKEIVVCGHTHCGAVKGLLNKDSLKDLPAMSAWLAHAEACRRIMTENYKDLETESLLNVAVQENVLVQLENLKTHPSVASHLNAGKLNLHAWVYKFETGEVFAYNPDEGQFLPITEFSTEHSLVTTSVLGRRKQDKRLRNLVSDSII
jgi:carbonic anhydrase